MNNDIVKQFIDYYVTTFNNKQDNSPFIKLWREYSILTFENKHYTKEELGQFLLSILPYTITNVQSQFNINGERRSNIMMTYTMNQFTASQFIQLSYSNSKEFWIHSSIMIIK